MKFSKILFGLFVIVSLFFFLIACYKLYQIKGGTWTYDPNPKMVIELESITIKCKEFNIDKELTNDDK